MTKSGLVNTVRLQDGTYAVSGVDIRGLVDSYGSPLYVYDGAQISARFQHLADSIAWADTSIYYAMKANYNPAILRHLNSLGAGIDAVSPAEVLLAMSIGFKKEKILFTANNITDREMNRVYGYGVLFNIGELSRLEKFGQAFPGSDVCLRFNPMVVAGEHARIQTGGERTKFGIPLEQVGDALAMVQRYKLRVVGLHKHTGSGIAETDKFIEGVQNLITLAQYFPELEFIDIGGGMKAPYHPDEKHIDYKAFGSALGALFKKFCTDYGKNLKLIFEPGKYLVAECGMLLLTVNTIKKQFGREIAGTDSGFTHLIRPVLYEAYHHILNISNPSGTLRTYDIVGNICETGDIFAEERSLPEIRENDVLAILNAGAYCYSMGSVYNLHSLPSEVFIDQGKPRLITKRLKDEGLVKRIMKGTAP